MDFNVKEELGVITKILIDMIADERISDDIRAEYIDKINEESATIIFIKEK
ncbi:hypothetical protein NE172_05800 [Clostridium botulinum]|uniref:hypothetical protein n=1 Tax=Clostridium botulinum TaxID=1491 RepID=UPI0001AAD5F3|nr:hypothetical protein [Clostridium botulinum]EES50231.1 hypothetical protein CLO_1531 [Clostridium botulinum E1 str. 'BoNT E Beluga']MBY6760677.1 hypothetical protein [Clostridium botulinum]MBY6919584.1 hypothetical protein [Clostridium botulinum]MCR1130463.1 hypothetical protein [Clostridium botulinum]HBZ6635632.1 hypothetical protein [Clostridium botulinum]